MRCICCHMISLILRRIVKSRVRKLYQRGMTAFRNNRCGPSSLSYDNQTEQYKQPSHE